MFYSGFADEAGSSIDIQIKATKELGWNYIELRAIDDINITDISEEKFEEVYYKLTKEGIKVNCFGSNIANYSKNPLKDEDFNKCVEELKRAIPRMQKFGTKYIRGMSFTKEIKNQNADIEKIIFSKLKKLVNMCEEAGIIYLHENCANYFSQSWDHTLRLVDSINSDNFGLIFDTGNALFTENKMGKPPYEEQNSWDFYNNIKEHIKHIHIKDARRPNSSDKNVKENFVYTFPGDGEGCIKKIVEDLLKNNYNGGFSIEPHIAVVYHDKDKDIKNEEVRYKTYVEYGRQFMKLVEG